MKQNLYGGRLALAAVLLVSLSGCHSLFGSKADDEKAARPAGERIAVLDVVKKQGVDDGISDYKPELPDASVNKDWLQMGGSAEHAAIHPELALHPKEIWSASIGDGSSKYLKLIARPVVSDGKIFTLDSEGLVKAFRTKNGENIWEFDTTPAERDDEAMGGGLGIADGVLYVTTGFGEVLALNLADGKVVWRKMVGKPYRSAPTISNDRVFVVSLDNELTALSAKTGDVLWHHNGIAESASLMGSSSPAASGDTVIVAYTSGEIFSLRAQNGRVAWTDVLSAPAQVGALPAIADIRGLPVMDRGYVYAISHSGRMAAIDQRTGDRAWEAYVGGINTPLVIGNTAFVITNDNELMALTRSSGKTVWIEKLQRLTDPEDRESTPVLWWGPLLAGGRLWVTNSLGHLVAFNPDDGTQLVDEDISDGFYMPPVVANNTMYLVSDNGKLIALR